MLSVISLTAFAGPQDKGQQRKGKFEIPKELNLSADQQKKFESLNAEFKSKMDEMMKSLDQLKGKQGELKGLADEHQKAIKELLTPEQIEKWKEMMPKFGQMRQFDARGEKEGFIPGDNTMRHGMRDGSGPRKGKMGYQKGCECCKRHEMFRGDNEDFGPSDKGMFREGKRNKFEGLNLSDNQKEAMKELKEKFSAEKKVMQEKHRAEMEKILTPEQRALLKERQDKFKAEGKLAPKDNQDVNKEEKTK